MGLYFIFINEILKALGITFSLIIVILSLIAGLLSFISGCISGLKIGFFDKEAIGNQAIYETPNILMQSSNENMLNSFSTSKVKKIWVKVLIIFFALWMTIAPLYDVLSIGAHPSWIEYF